MKSKKLKRILALVLCMALLLSTGLSALASTEGAAETPVPEVTDNQEPQAASVEGEEETTAGETTTTESQEQQPEVPAEANTDNAPETTEAPETKGTESVSGVKDLVGGTETQTEPEVVSEAVELKQEFTDANGKVVQRVTANVPEGAFTAKASEVTMEVTYLDEAAENRIKEMMTKQLPENDILGDYILYDIKFKVNGTVTEPKKAIAITLEGSGLHIEDTKKANAFYIDPADPVVENDKDEIIEITQKNEMIENLQKAGQSTENIDEYDLSEISVNADGVAEKILMEGRISTIYGCYVETLSKETVFEKEVDGVVIKVLASEGAFPVSSDKVSMTAETVSEERHKEIEEELTIKAEKEGKKLVDFLVYDIDLWTNGEKIQPQIPVTVTFENTELNLEDTDSVLGFQIDENDNVKSIEGNVDEQATAVVEAEHFTETGLMATAAGKETIYIEAGKKETIKNAFSYGASSKKVTTTNESIATGTITGSDLIIEGIGAGTAQITVSYKIGRGDRNKTYVVTVYESQKGLSINDNIINDGRLNVQLSEDLQKKVEAAESIKYVWYKSINGGAFEEVIRKKHGDDFNYADDGEWLNVALDKGALSSEEKRESVIYRVAAVINDKSQPIATSDDFSVEYWDELQNGSFEKPVLRKAHTQIKNGSQGVIWKTTGLGTKDREMLDHDIELINVSTPEFVIDVKKDYHWYGTPAAVDGVQFAELNCEAEGALYQDVLTIKDVELNYWLSHRARGTKQTSQEEKDTMYVVIMPSIIAQTAANGKEIDTQKKLLNYLQEVTGKEKLPDEYIDKKSGVFIKKYTSNDQKWSDYEGNYTPTSYLSRFFFVAGDTASKSATIGNFLDNVGFSQKLPPANPEQFRLQIKKTISGLSEESYKELKENLSFEIKADNTKAPFHNTTIKASDNRWSWTKNDNGSYTGVYELTNKIAYGTTYEYTITEKNETVDGYNLTSTVTVNGVEQDITDDKKSGKASVTEKSAVSFVFANHYFGTTPPDPDINEDIPNKKYIDYLGDGATNPDTNLAGDEFYRLYLDVTGIPNKEPDPADVIFVLDVSRSMSFSMNNDEDAVAAKDNRRIEKLRTAAKTAVNALMTGNANVNVSVIPFHSWINDSGDNAPLFNKTVKEDVIRYLNRIDYETEKKSGSGAGGTNYQAAFERAKTALDSLKDNGHKKYVVFVSDGQPTIYTSGGKYVSDTSVAKSKGIAAAKDLTKIVPLNGFYTVSVGPSTGKQYLKEDITPLPVATYKKWLDGTSTEDLNNTFSAIAGSITRQIGNVTITDELSKYVEFVYDGNKVDNSTIELKVTKKLPGAEKPTEILANNYTWAIDKANKKISVNFGEGYFLERNAIYTISFNVKLTDSAYTDTPTDIGDKETDYPGNETSSGQSGFYANNKATLTYSRVTNDIYEEETKEYTKPVVQPRVSHDVEKKWNGTIGKSIKVRLKASVEMNNEPQDVTDKVLSETARQEVTLDAQQNWVYKWNNLPQKYYPVINGITGTPVNIIYTVEETEIVQETGADKKYETTVENSEDGIKTIITNSEVSQWQIIKASSSDGNLKLKDAEFELKSDKKTYTGKSIEGTGAIRWNGVTDTGEIEPGKYTLTETKAPTGYAKSDESWTVNIAYKGAVPTITDKDNKTVLIAINSEGIYECTFLNTPVYELPSTGGSGIFWYMIGGVLLMMAGVLILYKKKYREVLESK